MRDAVNHNCCVNRQRGLRGQKEQKADDKGDETQDHGFAGADTVDCRSNQHPTGNTDPADGRQQAGCQASGHAEVHAVHDNVQWYRHQGRKIEELNGAEHPEIAGAQGLGERQTGCAGPLGLSVVLWWALHQ